MIPINFKHSKTANSILLQHIWEKQGDSPSKNWGFYMLSKGTKILLNCYNLIKMWKLSRNIKQINNTPHEWFSSINFNYCLQTYF